MQLRELLLKFFGHKSILFAAPQPKPNQQRFRPTHFEDNSPQGWLSLSLSAAGTAPASLLPLHTENLLPKRNVLTVPCTWFSKNCHRTPLIKTKILSRQHYHTKPVEGLTVCSLLASTAHKITTVRRRGQEEPSYSA